MMLALALALILTAPGDPQFDDAGGAIVLNTTQRTQVATFIGNTWPGVALADVRKLHCAPELGANMADSCLVIVDWENRTAAQAVALLAAGWRFGRTTVTRHGADDYSFRARSPARPGAAGLRTWLDGAFGAGSGDSYRRLTLARDGPDVTGNLRVRATSTALLWFEAWLGGGAGGFVGTE